MADAKPPSKTATDAKKSSASSKAGKHDKKDENIVEKTAHNIRERVHEFTDEVKEKAHHLTHSDDSKKGKDSKKSDTKLKASSHPPKTGKKGSDADDDDDDDDKEEDNPSKPPPPPSAPSKPASDDKKGGSASKASGLPSGGSKPPGDDKEDGGAAAPPSSKPPSGGDSKPPGEKKDDSPAAPPSNAPRTGSASKSSSTQGGNQNAAASPSSSSKPSAEKPTNAPGGTDASNNPSAQENTDDKVHISFDGVTTVDDLLERIDEAIEKAKIIVNDGKNKAADNTNEEQNASGPGANKPQEKSDEDVIRIPFGDTHTLEDLLALINHQPGHRKVVLEGAPDQSSSVAVKKSSNPQPTGGAPSTSNNEEKDSAATTTTKTTENPPPANVEPPSPADQIHVNIENLQSVDDLLNRIDEAVQKVPIKINLKPHGNKNQASSKSDQKDQTDGDAEKGDKKDIAASLKFQQKVPETKEEGDNAHIETSTF